MKTALNLMPLFKAKTLGAVLQRSREAALAKRGSLALRNAVKKRVFRRGMRAITAHFSPSRLLASPHPGSVLNVTGRKRAQVEALSANLKRLFG